MREKLLLFIITLCTSMITSARFGKFGIEKQETFENYLQYEGQIVKYIVGDNGGTEYDKNNFIKAGGNDNKEYIIAKISGNIENVTFTLQERGGKKKIKLTTREKYYKESISYLPLLLVDKINSEKKEYLNRFNNKTLGVTDIILQKSDDDPYPHIVYEITDKTDNSKYYSNIEDAKELEDLGKTYSNPLFKCSYMVVNVFIDEKEKILSSEWKKHYTLKNSMDGSIEDVPVKTAEESIFKRAGSGTFSAVLNEVEKPSNPTARYGTTTSVKEEDITKFSYIDNIIDILLFVGEDKIFFTLKNISDNSIKIVWNEAGFVDVDGSSSKIMHTGIKYSEKDSDQPASTIIKGAKLDDIIVPVDKVFFDKLLEIWDIKSIYENVDKDKKGQIIRLMLPIQVKDVINEYIFNFEVTYTYNHPEYIVSQ